MTISTRIRGELFATQAGDKIPAQTTELSTSPQLIRLPLTRPPDVQNNNSSSKRKAKKKAKKATTTTKYKIQADPSLAPHRHGLPWTTDEHDRFLQGLELYPSGPWKAIAAFVGTRTPRQTMTHAQKYRQKIQRRRRGLLTSSRQPVPVTDEAYCGLVVTANANGCTSPVAAPTSPAATCSKSPTSVDTSVKSPDDLLENNWLDKVEVCELDTAFRAFLEVYDPTLFPMDEEHNSEFNCNMVDGASIVL